MLVVVVVVVVVVDSIAAGVDSIAAGVDSVVVVVVVDSVVVPPEQPTSIAPRARTIKYFFIRCTPLKFQANKMSMSATESICIARYSKMHHTRNPVGSNLTTKNSCANILANTSAGIV